MRHLLDTNVVSELRKRPDIIDPRVAAWAAAQNTHDLFVSVMSVLEIELGVALRERRDPTQGAVLRRWLEDGVLAGFAGRILPVGVDTARRAAHLHVPDPRPERDALIAATALEHGLTISTRNTSDFAHTGVVVVNPWLD